MSNKIGVTLRIDVTKIDKAQIYAGAKGKYLTVKAFIDPDKPNDYGDHGMLTQEPCQRDDNYQGPILGNAKVFWREGGQQPQQVQQQPQNFQQGQQSYANQQASQQQAPKVGPAPVQSANNMDFDDDIPFSPIGLQYNNQLLNVM